MAAYKPNTPFTVPMHLLIPAYTSVKGTKVKEYPDEGLLFYGSFRTFGGSERLVNGITAVVDTGIVDTWFRPDITADCRILISGTAYEVEGTPENINMRNQYLSIRVRAVKGGA